jgi:hypothetical protein
MLRLDVVHPPDWRTAIVVVVVIVVVAAVEIAENRLVATHSPVVKMIIVLTVR